jgi:hypothetical protein
MHILNLPADFDLEIAIHLMAKERERVCVCEKTLYAIKFI